MPEPYLTVQEIMEQARFSLPRERDFPWPGQPTQLRIANDIALEVQRLTHSYVVRQRSAYVTPWKTVLLTGKIPYMVKLLDARSTAGKPYDVIPVDGLFAYRQETPTLGEGVYVFAYDPFYNPGDGSFTYGTVAFHVYPAFTTNTSIDFMYEDAHPAITTLSTAVKLPSDAMLAGVAWQLAESVEPGKAPYLRAKFEEKCRQIRQHAISTHQPMAGSIAGGLAEMYSIAP